MKKGFKFIGRFFNATLVISALVVIGGVIFLYTYPFKVAQFNHVNLLNQVQAGSTINYNVDFCRYVGKGVEIYTRRFLVPKDEKLVNPIELSSNPTLETLDGITGCRVSKDIKLPVDLSVPEGEYRLLIQVRYCIIVGRCIPVEGYSDYFMIDKPNIPNRLSVINDELSDIRAYIQTHPNELNEPVQPNVAPSVQSNAVTPQTESQSQPTQTQQNTVEDNRGVLQQIIDKTNGTVQNLINGIRGL